MARGRRASVKAPRRSSPRKGAAKGKRTPTKPSAPPKRPALRALPAKTSAPRARATIPDSPPEALGRRREPATEVSGTRRPGLVHDTPVDTPAVKRREPDQSLVLPKAMETLESAYEAWLSLRTLQVQTRQRLDEERKRLEQQAALLVGAMRLGREAVTAARGALVAPEKVLGDAISETEARLAEAREALEAQAAEAEAEFTRLLSEARAVVRDRVERQASLSPPVIRLAVQSLPGDKRVLQLQRPSPDDAVSLFFVLSGHIPSRYDALADDATDDVSLPPAALYAELGVAPADVRPKPARLVELLAGLPEVWPLKGLVVLLPGDGPGPGTAVRWISRGPVLEAEIADRESFRLVLAPPEAEQITAQLMRHSLEQRLTLELVRV